MESSVIATKGDFHYCSTIYQTTEKFVRSCDLLKHRYYSLPFLYIGSSDYKSSAERSDLSSFEFSLELEVVNKLVKELN